MKQYYLFLNQLQNNGYTVNVLWQQNIQNKENCYIEAVIISDNTGGNFVSVLFHVYGENTGFEAYIQSKGNDMNVLENHISEHVFLK